MKIEKVLVSIGVAVVCTAVARRLTATNARSLGVSPAMLVLVVGAGATLLMPTVARRLP